MSRTSSIRQADALGLRLAENFDAIIFVDSNLDEGVSCRRRSQAPGRAGENGSTGRSRRFSNGRRRLVEVGNGLYPTAVARQTLRDDGRRAEEDVLGRRQRGLREPRGKSRTGQGSARRRKRDSDQGRERHGLEGPHPGPTRLCQRRHHLVRRGTEGRRGGARLPPSRRSLRHAGRRHGRREDRPAEGVLSGAGNTESDLDLCRRQTDLDDRVRSRLRADEGALRCGRGGQGPVRRGRPRHQPERQASRDAALSARGSRPAW